MSERKLREHLETYMEVSYIVRYHQAATEALAADPDVVEALEILAEAAREHEKLLDDGAEDWNAGYEYGFYDAAVSLAFEIEKALRIRLTADGWEWTDNA